MTDKTREKIAEIILAVRQYLLNTEFAPEPLGEPVDPKKLTEYFPDAILAIPEIKEGQELLEKRDRLVELVSQNTVFSSYGFAYGPMTIKRLASGESRRRDDGHWEQDNPQGRQVEEGALCHGH